MCFQVAVVASRSALEPRLRGRDASIATHIENICKRGYVNVGSGRTMVPTELGIVLVQGYRAIDPDLVEPTVRSYVERQLDLIAAGTREIGTVVTHVLTQFLAKFRYFVANIGAMDALFDASMGGGSGGRRSVKPLVACGKTGRLLQLHANSRPPRLYNKLTEEVYSLPQGGVVKAYGGKTCPLDGFELCIYTTGGRSYPLCPNCYNYPPAALGGVDAAAADGFDRDAGKEDMRAELQRSADAEGGDPATAEGEAGEGGGGTGALVALCQRCPHSELHPAVAPLVVCACPDTAEKGGALILDPTGGPNWKLVSTQCSYMVSWQVRPHKVRVLPEVDEASGAHYLEVEFNRNHCPLVR